MGQPHIVHQFIEVDGQPDPLAWARKHVEDSDRKHAAVTTDAWFSDNLCRHGRPLVDVSYYRRWWPVHRRTVTIWAFVLVWWGTPIVVGAIQGPTEDARVVQACGPKPAAAPAIPPAAVRASTGELVDCDTRAVVPPGEEWKYMPDAVQYYEWHEGQLSP